MRSLVLVAALLGGCDPGFTMQGDVVDAAGRPIAGARAVFTCWGADQNWADTDSTGHFKDERIGVFGDDCAVEVRVPGHRTVSFPVMASCTNVWRRRRFDFQSEDLCAEVTVHATIR